MDWLLDLFDVADIIAGFRAVRRRRRQSKAMNNIMKQIGNHPDKSR